jgi:hypothetical protein
MGQHFVVFCCPSVVTIVCLDESIKLWFFNKHKSPIISIPNAPATFNNCAEISSVVIFGKKDVADSWYDVGTTLENEDDEDDEDDDDEDEDDCGALSTSITANTATLFSGFGFLFDLDNPND